MFGFHRRQRSLIPVRELSKYDVKYEKVDMEEEEEDFEDILLEEPSKPKSKQMTLIYIIYLAESYVSPCEGIAAPSDPSG
jgi:hypothetical protein